MKKRTKRALIAAGIFILIGCICAGIGIAAGALRHRDQWGVSLGGFRIGFFTADGGDMYPVDETYTEEIKKLDFEIGLTTMKIVEGDCFSVTGTSPTDYVSTVDADGTWHFRQKGKIGVVIPTLSFSEDIGGGLTVTVPKGTTLEQVKIEIGMGELDAFNLNVIDWDVQVGMGSGNLNGVTAESMNLDCGMGELNVHLQGKPEDYDYDLDCGMGNLEIEDVVSSGGLGLEQEIRHGTGRLIKVECGMGSVRIDFEE